jgi:uncharacterized membrane protein YuzA (DUF378 family)
MKGGCVVSMIMKILVIIGGINWGLVGVSYFAGGDWNVVKLVLGAWPTVENIVYILVGLAAISMIFGCKCAKCKAACASCMAGGDKMDMGGKM